MTNGVANLYDRLDAKERTAACVAAMFRGDDLETQRLNATAPLKTERRLHHLDRVQAVWNIAATVRIEQLTTLANLWHAQARLAWAADTAETDGAADDPVPDDLAREVRLWRVFVDVATWKLSQQRAAWSIVCERLAIPPEFLDQFGDCITLRLTEARLADNTPSAETVRNGLAEFSCESVELATADSIAAGWLDLFAGLNG